MKKTIYKIGTILCLAPALMGTVSCDDWFAIMPQSELVYDDFWKDEKDVKSAVGACYRGMNENSFIQKLIAWGEVRSDNLVYGKKTDDTELNRLLEATINPTSWFAKWGEFYTVINNCNTLIKNAPAVRERDLNFSEAHLNQYLAEAKTIRAFCYFTLVRAFNRVPYVEEAYTDDTRSYEVAQSEPEDLLKTLIADLKGLEELAAHDYGDDLDYNKGRVTQKAVWALMADMYLWLEDYDNCIEYCNKVLDTGSNPLTMTRSSLFFNSVFFSGNSTESIWELQFDSNTQNGGVREYYGGANDDPKLSSYYRYDAAGNALFDMTDIRGINSYASRDGFSLIKKYVANRYSTSTTVKESDFLFGQGTNNWILYRLPDIYLMKAEALAERGSTADLELAVELVSKTYDRAHPEKEPGSLIGQYVSQGEVRDLVFDERQREFMFEGKRYFDLVRRMRREGSPVNIVDRYLQAKYVEMKLDWTTVETNLKDADAIYMPIHRDELLVNRLLKQNRFYETSSDISKD